MTTYPLATLAAQVSASGIAAPPYDDVYLSLVAKYQAIYGTDVVLTADTQDGQWIGVLAQVITDVNAAAIAVYNSFSPATASGNGLASVVKINGLAKQSATFSTCLVTVTGDPGTVISGGSVKDGADNIWLLPASVTIPPSASITVTATSQNAGAVHADVGSITKIATPTRGWLSVTNPAAAAVGVDVESDAKLRARQAASTAIGATSPMESIAAAVQNIEGVTRLNYSENPTGSVNSDGVPAHSFCMVVEGGDAVTIAQTIADSKTPGTGTFGTISESVVDPRGIPSVIKYDAPTYKRIVGGILLKPLPGYTVAIGDAVIAAIAAFITALPIGTSISINDAIVAAIESGGRGAFKIPPDGVTLAIFGGAPSAVDIAIAFNEAASCDVSDLALSIVS